jgi:hypothetical protein
MKYASANRTTLSSIVDMGRTGQLVFEAFGPRRIEMFEKMDEGEGQTNQQCETSIANPV